MGSYTQERIAGPAGWSVGVPLAEGDAGTAQTVALIRSAIAQSLNDPLVRGFAGRLIRDLPPGDTERIARTIFAAVHSHVRFVPDPVGHETISSARWTLEHGFGDCDDINGVLLPSLLGAVGIPTRLVTVATLPGERAFTHIYAEADIGGRWIPVDAARSGATFGTAPRHFHRARVWETQSNKYVDVPGLSGVTYMSGVRRGMGDAVQWVQPIAAAATQIISAIRAPNYMLQPGASIYYPNQRPAAAMTFGEGSVNPMWIVLGGGLLLFAMRK